ncbi:MAG: hypothetical protein K0Q84_2765, partial [Arthrobacter sp.]|nr:hypothetical protein [Arthrobacter sp.]
RPRPDRSHCLCVASTAAMLCPRGDGAAKRSPRRQPPGLSGSYIPAAELLPAVLGDELTDAEDIRKHGLMEAVWFVRCRASPGSSWSSRRQKAMNLPSSRVSV